MHLISSMGEQGEEKKESWTLETHLESLVQFQFQVIICSNMKPPSNKSQIFVQLFSILSQNLSTIFQIILKYFSNISQKILKYFSSISQEFLKYFSSIS